MKNKEKTMNLNKDKENLELLSSVGAVINNKTGDVFDIMADGTIDFNDPSNILEMWNDQFNCEEWFNALHTLDRPVVDRVINNLKVQVI
tara:strand:- start:2261 stop:2527 length:267 start_codon:yes stop_codon:yes gene_type:complete